MLITFNQMARFKPTTTAKRLKAYYHSQESRPAVFLSYLCLVNVVASLCPTVAKLETELYREEVRELFFANREVPEISKYLWRFRRFFTVAECCDLLKGNVTERVSASQEGEFDNEWAVFGLNQLSIKDIPAEISHRLKAKGQGNPTFSIEYSENLEKSVDSLPQFKVFCY